MMESICKIQEYTNSMDFETFDRDNKTIDACLMQFQHLWETANKLKTNFPEENSLPYSEIIGLRNFIAHEYLGIDIGIVWDTISEHLPTLELQIKHLLETR
jgi:uncharacterized protein with HEPN domain